jgi:hypothetical protein
MLRSRIVLAYVRENVLRTVTMADRGPRTATPDAGMKAWCHKMNTIKRGLFFGKIEQSRRISCAARSEVYSRLLEGDVILDTSSFRLWCLICRGDSHRKNGPLIFAGGGEMDERTGGRKRPFSRSCFAEGTS